MIGDQRNPYVILGLPFGASRDVASRAFAQRARGLRRQADGTERLTELTWALNQVQEALKDPATALHVYRVPADPGALEPDQPGLLRPGPIPMERTSPSSADAWAALLHLARTEAHAAVRAEAARSVALPPR